MTSLTFLQEATPETLSQAVAFNHFVWMTTRARAAGGEVEGDQDVRWTLNPQTGKGEILFPRLKAGDADQRLDTIMSFYRQRGAKNIGCWSLDPPQPADLGLHLLGRGFQLGWRPRWMWLNLHQMRTDHGRPPGLQIEEVQGATDWAAEDLPYYEDAASEAIRQALTGQRPQKVWHFAARLDGQVVGHTTIFLSLGPVGIAGVYDVGVVPGVRGQGIGKAVVAAACQQAQAMGARYAMLNGTGESMYRQIGFERLGFGRTWWMLEAALAAPPPTAAETAYIAALGKGAVDDLDGWRKKLGAECIETPLANGMTPLSLAVGLGNQATAQWLVDQGAELDVLSAWDLGWRQRIPALLAANPGLVDRQSGERQMTPLHTAAERGDTELARVLLQAGADLDIKDAVFGGPPLGWARHFGRADMVTLIEAHQAS
ncbi:MAG: GNAT family N-acetyltransferase [Candidatus Latescibacteria bacterium]|nr:GNAT family N-acetyltransferase [Candidatus Latescibacterota bacterium]